MPFESSTLSQHTVECLVNGRMDTLPFKRCSSAHHHDGQTVLSPVVTYRVLEQQAYLTSFIFSRHCIITGLGRLFHKITLNISIYLIHFLKSLDKYYKY